MALFRQKKSANARGRRGGICGFPVVFPLFGVREARRFSHFGACGAGLSFQGFPHCDPRTRPAFDTCLAARSPGRRASVATHTGAQHRRERQCQAKDALGARRERRRNDRMRGTGRSPEAGGTGTVGGTGGAGVTDEAGEADSGTRPASEAFQP